MLEPIVWLRPEFKGHEDDLINLAGGARLIGVTHTTVYNWRARKADFPKVVMLTGPEGRRANWIPRAEFLAFARTQLDKPRGTAVRPRAGRRPRRQILAERLDYWTRQAEKAAELERRAEQALNRARDRHGTATRQGALMRELLERECQGLTHAGQPPAALTRQ
jgi:predicted DNA-binding transcriptional regulator AlpA